MSGSPTGDSDLRYTLKRVAVTLKQAQVPFALGGGYASWARGGPEPEHDVDFLLAPEDIPHALHVLEQAGLRVVQPPEDWLAKVFDDPSHPDGESVMVDLIHRPAERPVTRAVLAEAEELSVDSVLMPVLDATELLIGKMLAMTAHYCDFAKLLPHARALREQVDWRKVKVETAQSPYAQAFLFLIERLGLIEPLGVTHQDRPAHTALVAPASTSRAG